MNAQETKRLIGEICPELDLDGCYAEIVPRVTGQQLGKLLGVAERGHNAETWSYLAVKFLQYGQQGAIAANIDRLVAAITDSCDAAWALYFASGLNDKHRNALVMAVTKSGDAAWALVKATNLSDENRAHLEKVAG